MTTERETQPTRYAGADWLRVADPGATISEFGARVADLLGEFAYGLYHIDWKTLHKVDWSHDRFVRITLCVSSWSTYDGDELTRLVILAHREAIRIQIAPCNFTRLEVMFHRHERHADSWATRHPTLTEAVTGYQERMEAPY